METNSLFLFFFEGRCHQWFDHLLWLGAALWSRVCPKRTLRALFAICFASRLYKGQKNLSPWTGPISSGSCNREWPYDRCGQWGTPAPCQPPLGWTCAPWCFTEGKHNAKNYKLIWYPEGNSRSSVGKRNLESVTCFGSGNLLLHSSRREFSLHCPSSHLDDFDTTA